MFEKSLYDLIRGLRNHKDNERDYIQHSLRECRSEIRGPDMDLKATALLKLIYLEMFGHDMSWASFHVLEVMSSSKYHQKRVGYLGAVQSFRSDTEVLMLATNLLKKDINSPLPPTISLPIAALPHVITSSLALSLSSDLLPRLSHSKPGIRKKTVAALYRLALAYPDTLRSAWPKIKDLLMDEEEDSSVTAAVVNVVCELGWRRPRDFLPLAPRLFDLLVEGGNNWMAIKIIKLFATLTPLEPRLIKKLLPPLTTLIRTTPAMSLLYECINGIVQGGILESTDGVHEGEEIVTLCVDKLRGMIMIEGDPNLKYVALLAFNKIVTSHAYIVSQHQDVIMLCIDDPDISIRLQALELEAGMVNSDNLVPVVERLMKQLRSSPLSVKDFSNSPTRTIDSELVLESEGEDSIETLQLQKSSIDQFPALPTEYRITVMRKIIEMCSKDTYANIADFEWYLEILVQLVGSLPSVRRLTAESPDGDFHSLHEGQNPGEEDISSAIGWELRNVAVRVSTIRTEAVDAAVRTINLCQRENLLTTGFSGGSGVLGFAVWIVGEFAANVRDVHETLNSLINPQVRSLPATTISAYLQAVPKLLAFIATKKGPSWNMERKTMISLLLARVLHFLEPLTAHPNLDVQERSVELAELIRVTSQAVNNHDGELGYGPLLLTKVIPSLFAGSNLNPVAPTAQKKVPLSRNLSLDTPFNQNLSSLLHLVDSDSPADMEHVEFKNFYSHRGGRKPDVNAAFDSLLIHEPAAISYQQSEDDLLDSDVFVKKRIERRSRNRDDPFYIGNEEHSSGTSTPFHEILKLNNGGELNVDSIPIMHLDLGERVQDDNKVDLKVPKSKHRSSRAYVIADDENIDMIDSSMDQQDPDAGHPKQNSYPSPRKQGRVKKSLLEVDSSRIGSYSISGVGLNSEYPEIGFQGTEDEEMEKALKEIERLRLEMQRASERTEASSGIPPGGTLIKKRKKKKRNVQNNSKELPEAHAVGPALQNDLGVTADMTVKRKLHT